MKLFRIEVKDLSLKIDPYGGTSIELSHGSVVSPTTVALAFIIAVGVVVIVWIIVKVILMM